MDMANKVSIIISILLNILIVWYYFEQSIFN